MNKGILRLIFSVLFLTTIIYLPARAQTATTDLTNTHVDELSDSQIQQMMQQASAAGYSDNDLILAAEKKGLPVTEATKLRARVSALRQSGRNNTNAGNSAQTDTSRALRRLNFKTDSDSSLTTVKQDMFARLVPRVFGSEIFKNANLSFTPDLKIATPRNYIVGPADQININVYGNSLVNWKLEVSPEGNINIPGVGLVNVAGKSIEQATSVIKQRLAAHNYAVGRGTDVQVSLGNIRSIKVTMIGEVTKPGSYTLPSLATVFNALYAAGGPNSNGSYRQIEIIRDSRLIRTLDIYDFLLKGDQRNNIMLQDQDIIRIPSYRTHVEMAGEVKDPAIFEVMPGETLSDVIRFASGFTDQAYTGRIKVLQVSDQQRRITDIVEADYKNYIPLRGDKFVVDRILNRFENRVTISGAVFRPGDFELDNNLTVSGLIAKASGLKEDAFTNRASITRLKPDNSLQYISFDLKAILNKTAPDIPLQREDSVYISSKFDLRDKYTVTIKGEVRKPGQFAYADSMKVSDLIVKAGGFAVGATSMRIEVAERIKTSDPKSAGSQLAVVHTVDLDPNLGLGQADFTLQPYDIVSVYSSPGYEKQKVVKIEGEVLYPGYYTIKTKDEKISDIVKRAGNLTASADVDASSLRRSNSVILGINKQADSAAIARERTLRLQHIQQGFKDSTSVDAQLRNNLIGINLREILDKPGSRGDLILEDGDVLRVPKQQQIVKVNGEVLYPSVVVYEHDKSLKDYVINAGGYSAQALRRGAYVVYPNGTVKGTRKFLFFNSHPEVRPGSEIIIPKKPAPRANGTQNAIAITTGLASLGAIILGILSLHK